MKLRRIKCKARKTCPLWKDCVNLPLELHSKKNRVDLLIVGEGAGREEEKALRPFIGKSGKPLRNCVRVLEKEFDFSYAISNIIRTRPKDAEGGTRAPTVEEMIRCSPIILKEIKKYRPKIIVALGKTPHSFFHSKNDFSMLLEEGCVRTIRVEGKKYKSISSVHPAFCLRNDPCSIGFVYNILKEAVLYTKGVNFNIPNKFNAVVVEKVSDVKKLLKELMNTPSRVAVDTECNNLNRVFDNQILSIQLCNDGKTGYVIPLGHFDSPFSPSQLLKIKSYLKVFFTSKKSKVPCYIFQNPKYDMHQLMRELHFLLYNAPIIDTSFNAYLLEENWSRFVKGRFPKGKGPYSLYTLARKHGFTHYEDEGVGKEDRHRLAALKIEEWANYAAADAVVPWNLYNSQLKQAKYQGYDKFKVMSTLFHDHLVRTLTYTEHCGLPANLEKIRELHSPRTSPLIKELDKIRAEYNSLPSVKKVLKKLRKTSTGYAGTLFSEKESGFNPSKKIHREILFFDILQLKLVEGKKKKKTSAPSTDTYFQEVYKDVREVQLLRDWNTIQKLKTSYVDNIYNFMNKSTGKPDFYSDVRIRPSFRSDAVTGRLRAADPNTQQRVRKGDRIAPVLAMYEAKPGRCVVKIDYSTFEVRGLGIVSKDRMMKKLFIKMNKIRDRFREDPASILTKKQRKKVEKITPKKRWGAAYKFAKQELKNRTDFHKRAAALFNQIKIKKISKEQRQGAKNFVFGVIYGRGLNSIAKELGILIEAAKKVYQSFTKTMPDAIKWLQYIERFGRKHLYVESLIGRRRRLWGYLMEGQGIAAKMDRLGRNSPIQGVCSDWNIIATSLLIKHIYKKGKAKYQVPDKEAWMTTNLVHDATELELPIKDLLETLTTFEAFFTTKLLKHLKKYFGVKIEIPFEVDIKVGLKYSDVRSWDGTKKQAGELVTWLRKEEGRRGNAKQKS